MRYNYSVTGGSDPAQHNTTQHNTTNSHTNVSESLVSFLSADLHFLHREISDPQSTLRTSTFWSQASKDFAHTFYEKVCTREMAWEVGKMFALGVIAGGAGSLASRSLLSRAGLQQVERLAWDQLFKRSLNELLQRSFAGFGGMFANASVFSLFSGSLSLTHPQESLTHVSGSVVDFTLMHGGNWGLHPLLSFLPVWARLPLEVMTGGLMFSAASALRTELFNQAHLSQESVLECLSGEQIIKNMGFHAGNMGFGAAFRRVQNSSPEVLQKIKEGISHFVRQHSEALTLATGLAGALLCLSSQLPHSILSVLGMAVPLLGMAAATTSAQKAPIQYRDYQLRMLEQLQKDIRSGAFPWLALAAPMQTGKSLMTRRIVELAREEYGADTEIIVLTDAQIITEQIEQDLMGAFDEPIGRFDKKIKKREKITVCSRYALARNLDQFAVSDRKVVIINDEAYSTQARGTRAIYSHFGLGEVLDFEGQSYMIPKQGNGLVVGFSGTGMGLEGYHISGQLNLLEAIQGGWIRHMQGEQIQVSLSYDEVQKKNARQHEIWWKPTEANAEALVELYAEKMHDKFKRPLIYVPTIEHGELFMTALHKKYGDQFGHFVHSDLKTDKMFLDALNGWRNQGGPLVSIRRIGRGFRASEADAVFHTYTTASPEYFAQRTGRAWAKTLEAQPDLHVFEVVWSQRGSFANLARLLGLIDYPGKNFNTRDLETLLGQSNRRRVEREEVQRKIDSNQVSPTFSGMPLEEKWRTCFQELLSKEASIAELCRKTGIAEEVLAGYALGALPVRQEHLLALSDFLGGKERALELWVNSWQGAVIDILSGRQKLHSLFEEELIRWKNKFENLDASRVGEAAEALDIMLQRFLPFLQNFYKSQNRIRTHSVSRQDLALLSEQLANAERLASEAERAIPNTLLEVRNILKLPSLSDPQWRISWRRLARFYKELSDNSELSSKIRNQSLYALRGLTDYFFERENWPREQNTLQEKIRRIALEAIALTYANSLPTRGAWPAEIGAIEHSNLRRWLRGEKISYKTNYTPAVFYRGLRYLFEHLGFKRTAVDELLLTAVFQDKNWDRNLSENALASDRLLYETRKLVALNFGGQAAVNAHRGKGARTLKQGEFFNFPDGMKSYLEAGRSLSLKPFDNFTFLLRFHLRFGSRPQEIVPLLYENIEAERRRYIEEAAQKVSERTAQSMLDSFSAISVWLMQKYGAYLLDQSAERESSEHMLLDPQEPGPAQQILRQKLLAELNQQLQQRFLPQEVQILKWIFEFETLPNGAKPSSQNIAMLLGVPTERISQFRAQALLKLRYTQIGLIDFIHP